MCTVLLLGCVQAYVTKHGLVCRPSAKRDAFKHGNYTSQQKFTICRVLSLREQQLMHTNIRKYKKTYSICMLQQVEQLLCGSLTAYGNRKHLTHPLGLNGTTKRQVNDFQNPLKTEPQQSAEQLNDIRNQQWRAFHVAFAFFSLHAWDGLHLGTIH